MADLPAAPYRQHFRAVAIEAARRAGAILQERARSGFHVEHKDVVNLVTDADHQAEQAIVLSVQAHCPGHQILAEERGLSSPAPTPFRWIIDPLDGTTNFAHGFPAYCVSIALEHDGRLLLGVVYDPTRQELFVAERGGGAWLNGQAIQVSPTVSLSESLLVTGFAYDIRESPENNLDHFGRFSLQAQGVRRTGSAALDLCYVACGRFDGYWELKLSPWDMAAGAILVEEAGGRLADFRGQPLSIYGKDLVASNRLIHDAMLKVLDEGMGRRDATGWSPA